MSCRTCRRPPSTGSSFDGREAELAKHGLHLLIKPALLNKLRAMIGFKLGQR